MPSLKDIRKRIQSVKNTQQITRAMKLVAAARMRKATERALASRPYADALDAMLDDLTKGGEVTHPLVTPHDEIKRITVVVVSSDRGLCGGFNGGLFRFTENWLQQQEAEIRLDLLGRKAGEYFGRRDWDLGARVTDRDPALALEEARELAAKLAGSFQTGDTDEVWVVYNRFQSVMTQSPEAVRILPIGCEGLDDPTEELLESEMERRSKAVEIEQVLSGGFVYEPNRDAIVETLLPLYLETRLFQVFIESIAGELAARMRAMDAATRNAGELIAKLTLKYNRARQAAITSELVEIISGAEAL